MKKYPPQKKPTFPFQKQKSKTRKLVRNIDKVELFFIPPPPPPNPQKKGRILDFLTTRFIAEKIFSNKTCG